MLNRRFLPVVTLLLCAAALLAQTPEQRLDPFAPEQHPSAPTVTFGIVFPGSDPAHYAISVDSLGNAAYVSDLDQNPAYATPGSGDVPVEQYRLKFSMPQPARERIFAAAEKLKYFNGSFDYTKGRVANTGAKTLIYADQARHFETIFNWSQNESIQELTKIFQSVSATLEFGRRLEHEYRYTKLALDDELKRMEEANASGELVALDAVAPTLQKIVNDRSVLHIARLRAQRLLTQAAPASAGTGAANR